MVRFGLSVILAALALVACGPASELKPETGADAVTPRNPFFGSWDMTAARIAPWWDGKGEEPAADPAFSGFDFEANRSAGPPMLTCDKPRYAVNLVPVRGLFQGMLPEPSRDAGALGIKDGTATVLTFDCLSGAKDVVLDFPMVDDDTILLGLDNVIYTFARTRG